jgi:hypothetical protein
MLIYLHDDETRQRVYPYIASYCLNSYGDVEKKKLFFANNYLEAENLAKNNTPKGFALYSLEHYFPTDTGVEI